MFWNVLECFEMRIYKKCYKNVTKNVTKMRIYKKFSTFQNIPGNKNAHFWGMRIPEMLGILECFGMFWNVLKCAFLMSGMLECFGMHIFDFRNVLKCAFLMSGMLGMCILVHKNVHKKLIFICLFIDWFTNYINQSIIILY